MEEVKINRTGLGEIKTGGYKMKLNERYRLEEDGWEQIEKGKWVARRLPESSASIRKSSINLSEDLRKFLDGFTGVEFFVNKADLLFGLRPSNDEIKAFRMKSSKKDGKAIAIGKVGRWTDRFGIFKAEWDAESGMIVIDLTKPLSVICK